MMAEAATVTVNSRNFDGSLRRTWNCRLLEHTAEHLLFIGEFEFEVRHSDLGHIRKGTISYEYYPLSQWFSIFRFHEPNGTLRNWYCNINMPPTFDNGVLNYVDLDIDVLIWPDGSHKILDEIEFDLNAERYSYPAEVRRKAVDALTDLEQMISKGELPFPSV